MSCRGVQPPAFQPKVARLLVTNISLELSIFTLVSNNLITEFNAFVEKPVMTFLGNLMILFQRRQNYKAIRIISAISGKYYSLCRKSFG